jgi:hypothetical protein
MGLIPCVGCVFWILVYVAYGCFGALAAYWMPPRREPGTAAGHGALAGTVAEAIGGGVFLILALGLGTVFLPLELLSDTMGGGAVGASDFWETFAGLIGSYTCGIGCYAVSVGIAAGLGALGGLLFAAIQPE